MEISLDNMQVSFMTAGIKTASDSVSLTAAETEIKSRSEAMDKFQPNFLRKIFLFSAIFSIFSFFLYTFLFASK